MKRTRGRRRHGGGSSNGGHQQQQHNNPNRSFDSNGPDVKVRGSAAHIYEKYQQLARDASSGGDRVLAENYLQHAEHYYRLVKAMQPQRVIPEFSEQDESSDDSGNGSEAQTYAQGQPQQPTVYDQPPSSVLDVVNPQALPGSPQPSFIEDSQPDALPAFLQKPVYVEKTTPAEGEGVVTPKPRRGGFKGARRPRFDPEAAEAKSAEVAASGGDEG